MNVNGYVHCNVLFCVAAGAVAVRALAEQTPQEEPRRYEVLTQLFGVLSAAGHNRRPSRIATRVNVTAIYCV